MPCAHTWFRIHSPVTRVLLAKVLVCSRHQDHYVRQTRQSTVRDAVRRFKGDFCQQKKLSSIISYSKVRLRCWPLSCPFIVVWGCLLASQGRCEKIVFKKLFVMLDTSLPLCFLVCLLTSHKEHGRRSSDVKGGGCVLRKDPPQGSSAATPKHELA